MKNFQLIIIVAETENDRKFHAWALIIFRIQAIFSYGRVETYSAQHKCEVKFIEKFIKIINL